MGLRCLIVDDSPRFLEAAVSSLHHEGTDAVATAGSSADALDQTGRLRPDVVLVDIGLGQESGFDLARDLVESYPYLTGRVILISTRAEEDFEDMIESSPAVGFIPKSRLSVTAIRHLLPPGLEG